MKIAGIIAEYDPFHNGHAYHIAATRAMGATHVAAVISGAFTQRGEPAMMTKWHRARMALEGGADLVLELPLPWAMAPAEMFAAGGVAVLNALGCISVLSFGSECGDAAALQRLAEATDTPAHQTALRQQLNTGLSYAAARQKAVRLSSGEADAALLAGPNNTLGVEYIRAARRQNAMWEFFTVSRQGAEHHAQTPCGTASAGTLRRAIREGRMEDVTAYIPPSTAAILAEALAAGTTPADPSRLHTALLAHLRGLSPEAWKALPYVSEGLENRLYRAARTADSVDALLEQLKTRRYSPARLRRILWAALLGIPADLPRQRPPYIRLLGFNARGREILAAARPSLPMVSSARQVSRLPEDARAVFALEQRASDVAALALPRPLPCGTDLTTKLLCL